MAGGKKSILFYVDWGETFKALTDEQAGKLIKHLCAYVNDENPQTDDPIVNAVFVNIRQQLKRDLKKYEDMCLKNKENGKKGGRPKKETEENPNKPNGFLENPTKAKKPDTDTDTDTDIDKEINNNDYYNDGRLFITRDQINKLKENYPITTIDQYIGRVLNWKKVDGVKSLYLTMLNWMKRDQVKTIEELKAIQSSKPIEEKKIPRPTSNPQSGQFC